MSTWSDPGNALYWPDTKPFVNLFSGTMTSGGTNAIFESSSYPNAVYLILGIDTVAAGDEPVQMTVSMWINAPTTIFYWDSQSTGEGLGVRFQWRGQLPVRYGQELGITGTVISGTSIPWSGIWWGLVLPNLQAGT